VVEDESLFDVLKWWNQNYSKYPVLSKLTRDVLCIPITIVAFESAFSARGRVLDDYRTSLKKDMMEILVCGGDWLKALSKTTIQTLEVNFFLF
jgi:hAT family C-terminal dimerisation region